MKTGFGIQNSGFRAEDGSRKSEVGSRAKGLFLLFSISCFLLPTSAFAATHVTGTYSLGANPAVMTTVNGTPEYGLVFVQRNKLVTYGGVQYGTQVENAFLNASGQLNDGAGHLWVDLIPSTTASPGDSSYVVTVNIQGTVHSEIWVVPDTATVDVALVRQAQPSLPAAPASFYQVVQHSGNDLPQRLKLNMTGTGVACSDNAGSLSTDCTITGGGGGGSAPIASATTSGTVKTDVTAGDPVVYLKTSADTLLAGKANSSHTHGESDVTSLVTDLAGKVPTSRTVSTTAPLAGGGALSSNLTLSMPAAGSSQDGYLSSGNWATFNSKENALIFSSPLSRSVNTISCPTCELTGNKNTASGYAGLTASSKLSASQGQEVWSAADLTDYSATSGAGTTALKTTITTPSSGQCLTWSGSDWVNGACSGGSSNHNLLSATHPDTAAATPVLGDLLYANSTPAWTKLAGNTTTTKKYLAQTGNGAISAAPAWTQPACGDLSNAATSCSTDTTNATNIGSGTLNASRLPSTAVQTNQSNTWTTGTQDLTGAAETEVVKAGTSAGAPATCTANKSLYIKTDATPAGQQVFLCNSTGNGWNLVGDGGSGGGGVSSLSGDGALITNSSSTGTVTLTVGTAAAHKYWGNNTGSSATASFVQPACGDLSNAATSCSTDATNATNISSGTLAAARLPAQTTYIPFDQCSPAQSANQGNSFWTVAGLTNWDAGHWEFVNAGTNVSGDIFCSVRIPHTVAATPNDSIVLDWAVNATSGNQVLQTCDNVVTTGIFNVGALTCATAQTVTVSGTAYTRTTTTFAVQATVAADNLLVVKIHKDSTSTLTSANLLLFGAYLKIDQAL